MCKLKVCLASFLSKPKLCLFSKGGRCIRAQVHHIILNAGDKVALRPLHGTRIGRESHRRYTESFDTGQKRTARYAPRTIALSWLASRSAPALTDLNLAGWQFTGPERSRSPVASCRSDGLRRSPRVLCFTIKLQRLLSDVDLPLRSVQSSSSLTRAAVMARPVLWKT